MTLVQVPRVVRKRIVDVLRLGLAVQVVQFLVDLGFLKVKQSSAIYPRLAFNSFHHAVSSVTHTFFSFLALIFSFFGKGFREGNFFITFGEWDSAESVSTTRPTFLHW